MFFILNQSLSIIYPDGENAFIVPGHAEKGDYFVNPCLLKRIGEHLLLKWWEEMFFFWNQSINNIYPNEENEFVAPNH